MATKIKNSFLSGKVATCIIAGASGGGAFYRYTNAYIGITPIGHVSHRDVDRFCDALQDQLFDVDGPEIVATTSSTGYGKSVLQVTFVQIHFVHEATSGPSDATLKKYFAMTLKAINAIK